MNKTPLQRVREGAILLVLIFVVATIGFRTFGDYDWVSAAWMVVITISTVGYGERSSFDTTTQVFTILVIVFGMTASAYTMGGVVQLMLEGELERVLGKRRMNQELRRMQDHVVICGFGRMGQQLTAELRQRGRSVVVIDSNPAIEKHPQLESARCIIGDATEEDVLFQAGIERANTLVVALPSDANNVFITLTGRGTSDALQIIARAEHTSTEKKLRQAGANRVVLPIVVGARQMARMITKPTTADLMELASETSFSDLEIDEIYIGTGNRLAGKKILETHINKEYRLLIIAIKHPEGELSFSPSAELEIQVDDTLIIVGRMADIDRFRESLSGSI